MTHNTVHGSAPFFLHFSARSDDIGLICNEMCGIDWSISITSLFTEPEQIDREREIYIKMFFFLNTRILLYALLYKNFVKNNI